ALVKSVLKSVMGNFSFLMVGICTYHYRETFPFLFTQNIVHSPEIGKMKIVDKEKVKRGIVNT
ncbi:hypothetical protein ACI1TM_10900, partial [Lactococcus garvieae]|uniref:hypothetical protein n=1 Tax=Lactococcus garvieae TaxID=1363 RepID=UPI003854FB35